MAFGLLISGEVMAFCPFADTLAKSMQEKSILALYQNCADGLNDDASQVKLAKIYDEGTGTISRDLKKAIKYYQLSSENGNAYSQARLAQLYMKLDQNREGRALLYEYLDSVVQVPVFEVGEATEDIDVFQGELLHPYVLLLLSNEKPENKWYYSSEELSAPTFAKKMLKEYKLDENKKQQLQREATRWKKRKLLEVARDILPSVEYQQFAQTLYPVNGKANEKLRNQMLKDFKVKVEQKKKQDTEGAKAFY